MRTTWRNDHEKILKLIRDNPVALSWLSKRYREVSEGLLQKKSPVEIANDLNITSGRVYQIIRHIPYRIRRMLDHIEWKNQEWIKKQREYRLLSEETIPD